MDMRELAEKLSSWIKGKVEEAGCRGAVFGMSGGIDSAVIAALCKRALPLGTLGVIMPCHSIPEDEIHALLVAEKFDVPTRKVALDSAYDTLMGLLPGDAVDESAARLAKANLKARLRMVTLYHFANNLKYLVVGSGNRSELAVGYFTKHGDSGVDILPIANLVKSQVRELAGELGISREIIDKPPSAGLWKGQTDEADLGFSYDALDSYLLTGETASDIKGKIESMMAVCDHKRQPPAFPPFP